MDNIEKFMRYVSVDNKTSCWNWTGCRTGNQQRYGSTRIFGVKERAHRVAWKLFKGEIPDGMCVCHHCDNSLCQNPEHLFLGTHTDNMQDKAKKGRCNSMRGEKASWRKLSADDVRTIRSMYSTKQYTQRGLAKIFGVSQSSILFILQRRNWASID